MSPAAPPVARVLAQLGRVRKIPTGWMAHCPAHEDREPSLSVSEGRDGRALLRCHAGCETAAIVAALGLSWDDLFDEPMMSPPATSRITKHVIRDRDGTPVATHVREDGSTGKRMYWRGGLGGRRSTDLPLYGIHELPADPDATIVITEGEKAVDSLRARGIPAVGTVTGASTAPSTDVLRDLEGRHVVLWPDADAPGRKHMQTIAERLRDIASTVRVATWPEAPPGGDAADYAGDPWDVIDAAEMLSAEGPVTIGRNIRTARALASETPERVEWIAEPWVARGAITELDGKPKAAGKTTFLSHLVAAVLDGRPFLGARTAATPVLLLSEQPPASLRQTLGRARLLERDDLHVLLWRDARGASWRETAAEAVAYCETIGARLLIVDTLPQFAGLRGDAENDAGAALEALEPLQAAAAAGLGVLIARHDRKSGGDVGESARGSSAFTGGVDIVLALRRGEPNQRHTIRHLSALSRFDETPAEVVIELTDDNGFVSLGSGRNVAVLEARERILDAIGDTPLTVAELIDRTGSTRSTLQAALDELAEEGRVTREGSGKRGDAYRYSVVAAKGFVSAGPIDRPAENRNALADLPAVANVIFADVLAESA